MLYRLYDDERLAEDARARLVAAGIKRRAIELKMLAGEPAAHVGSYADTGAHAHDAERDRVGSFASAEPAGAPHMGSYADTGAHAHDAERDHVGSFVPHQHADDILRDLVMAGLARDAAADCVARMGQGAALLLVRASADQQARVSEILAGGAA
jgi:hypothetical protein